MRLKRNLVTVCVTLSQGVRHNLYVLVTSRLEHSDGAQVHLLLEQAQACASTSKTNTEPMLESNDVAASATSSLRLTILRFMQDHVLSWPERVRKYNPLPPPSIRN